MIDNPLGGYRFLPGFKFLSFAAVANKGFAMERAVFRKPRSIETSLQEIQEYLQSIGRPLNALAGFEFRQYASQQWTHEAFGKFNEAHIKRLEDAGLLVDGQVPISRTNVVLNSGQDASEGGLHAFTYTVPSDKPNKDFVLAAVPELDVQAGQVIEEGKTDPAALRKKVDYIMDITTQRLIDMGLSWDDATGIQLYAEADLKSFFKEAMLDRAGLGGWRGIQWHHALPPIGPCIMELDARSVRADITI